MGYYLIRGKCFKLLYIFFFCQFSPKAFNLHACMWDILSVFAQFSDEAKKLTAVVY